MIKPAGGLRTLDLLWLAVVVVLAAAVAWHVWSAGHCVTLPGGHLCELP